MGDEWDQDTGSEPGSEQPHQDDLDKRLEDIRRKVIESTSEAQQRIKRVVDKAGGYWQQSNAPLSPRRASSGEEERIRHLAIMWSVENWQLSRDLCTYMDIYSWSTTWLFEV